MYFSWSVEALKENEIFIIIIFLKYMYIHFISNKRNELFSYLNKKQIVIRFNYFN